MGIQTFDVFSWFDVRYCNKNIGFVLLMLKKARDLIVHCIPWLVQIHHCKETPVYNFLFEPDFCYWDN